MLECPEKSDPRCSTVPRCLSNWVHRRVVDAPSDRAVGQTEVSQSLAVLPDGAEVASVQPVEVVEGKTGEAR